MTTSFSYVEPRVIRQPRSRWQASLKVVLHQGRESRLLQAYWDEVAALNQHTAWAADLTAAQALEQITLLRQKARGNRLIPDREALYQALALLREYSEQVLGMRPYDVQLLCVLAMLDQQLVQLAPGEGKTLALALVAIIQGWSGRPCHVVTANDYLATRDVASMLPLFQCCGLSATSVGPETPAADKAAAYRADLVYSTSKQLLADYLQDSIAAKGQVSRLGLTLSGLRGQRHSCTMRGLYSVIIDEADISLIDDAITPLIISSPQPDALLTEGVMRARQIVDQMVPGYHYRLNEEFRDVRYSRAGKQLLEQVTPTLPSLWRHPDRRKDLLQQSIMARDFFIRDRHYVLVDDAVVIVDESTGRMMPGRTWSYGLHQAIEARAGVPLTPPSKTAAKMSFQNFFKLYHRLCGASGTLQNIKAEIFCNYGTYTLKVPPRLPSRLRVHAFQAYPDQAAKWQEALRLVRQKHEAGLPVLLGTRNIADSEQLAERLTAEALSFALLNAKNHEQEAQIVAEAGLPGRITVATNMAGRGTDIKVDSEVLAGGGLVVIMLEPHESARVDWQLFGRSGRQGHPGEVIPLAAADDDLLCKKLPLWWQPLRQLLRQGLLSDNLARLVINLLIKAAQKRAQNAAFHQRQRLNRQDQKSREMMSFVKTD